MHMADALISAPFGGALWAVAAGATAYSARKLRLDPDESKVPLMGVLGAFVFAAQMINFSIPGTGASGHVGGGMILAILLGPHGAFLTIASVLTVQALFFADGGLLALGCNVFNIGFLPCLVVYPLIFRRILGDKPGQGRLVLASTIAAVIGLELGAAGVVLQTVGSGVSELPFRAFLLLMLPIHLAIGLVEGLVTAAVVSFVWKARPELVAPSSGTRPVIASIKPVLLALAIVALAAGLILSWFASSHPDGLEWAIARTSGQEELTVPADTLHLPLAAVQEKTAFLPDYDFQDSSSSQESWPAVNAGTSLAGFIGGGLTLLLAGVIGALLKKRARPA